jgi:hypothetical protein
MIALIMSKENALIIQNGVEAERKYITDLIWNRSGCGNN